MAVLRETLFTGQIRVDVPLLRTLDAGVQGDWDSFFGRTFAANHPLIIRGFTINTTSVVGSAANTLQLSTADGIVANLMATEAGSMLWIPTDRAVDTLNSTTNSNVVGSFTAGSTNTIGIDFLRSADASTADIEQFYNPDTKLESSKIVPLARTLNYQIVISTLPFSSQPNVVPLAIVVTTAQNNVASIQDARPLLGRLASGGDSPNLNHVWPFLTPRVEGATSSFTGPDKNFQGLKDWMDGMMTRTWEIGGGEAWFSGTADRNVSMINFGTPFGSGDNFAWDGTNLTWQGIRFTFDNSTGYYNTLADQTSASAGLTNLADGECIYVDLQRQTNAASLTAHKTTLLLLGSGTPPGSRQVVAVRIGANVFTKGSRIPVGSVVAVATTTSDGIVRLFQAPGSSSHPVVLNLDGTNSIAWTSSGSGPGLMVTGGASQIAIQGVGTTTGFGIQGIGGTAGSGGGTGIGVIGTGGALGAGVKGTGGTGAAGVQGNGGTGTEPGVEGFGGSNSSTASTDGAGVKGHGGGGTKGGDGVQGYGNSGSSGSGRNGLLGVGGAGGAGVTATGGSNGPGGIFTGTGTGQGIQVLAGASVTDRVAIECAGTIHFSDGSGLDPGTSTNANTLTRKNIPLCWISMGFNTTSTLITHDTLNCGTPTLPTTTTLNIPFVNAMANTNYCVSATVTSTSPSAILIPQVTVKATGSVTLQFYILSTAGLENLSGLASTYGVDVMITGLGA